MTKNKQQGITLIGMVLSILVIGGLITYGIPIGIAYLNKETILKATQNTLLEAKQNDIVSSRSIKNSILTKVALESFDLKSEDINVLKLSSGFEVDVSFIKEIEINEKIKIVVDLSFTEQSP